MGMPDVEAASSLRSGMDLLKQSPDNGGSSNTGLRPSGFQAFVVPARLPHKVRDSAQRC